MTLLQFTCILICLKNKLQKASKPLKPISKERFFFFEVSVFPLPNFSRNGNAAKATDRIQLIKLNLIRYCSIIKVSIMQQKLLSQIKITANLTRSPRFLLSEDWVESQTIARGVVCFIPLSHPPCQNLVSLRCVHETQRVPQAKAGSVQCFVCDGYTYRWQKWGGGGGGKTYEQTYWNKHRK